jgi:hypothetical protein
MQFRVQCTGEEGGGRVGSLCLYICANHGLIDNIDTKTKCRHLKKLTCKGLCGRFLLECLKTGDRDMLVFSTQLCELLPL